MHWLDIPTELCRRARDIQTPLQRTKGWGRQEGIDLQITACLDLCPNTSVHDKVVSRTFVEKYMVEKTTQKLTSFENWT